MTLAQRIDALLADKIAVDGDGSLLHSAIGADASASPTEMAYRRVETLLAAWEEMHREAAPLRARVTQLEEALGPFANLGSIQNAGDWINAGHVAAARIVIENAACLNCHQTLDHHSPESGYGLVCPSDAAARTDDERFTYTRPDEVA